MSQLLSRPGFVLYWRYLNNCGDDDQDQDQDDDQDQDHHHCSVIIPISNTVYFSCLWPLKNRCLRVSEVLLWGPWFWTSFRTWWTWRFFAKSDPRSGICKQPQRRETGKRSCPLFPFRVFPCHTTYRTFEATPLYSCVMILWRQGGLKIQWVFPNSKHHFFVAAKASWFGRPMMAPLGNFVQLFQGPTMLQLGVAAIGDFYILTIDGLMHPKINIQNIHQDWNHIFWHFQLAASSNWARSKANVLAKL